MTLIDLLVLLCVAGLCGAIGGAIAGHSRRGCLVNVALGFIGAIFGLWIARALNLPTVFVVGWVDFPVLWSIIGSALFVTILGLFSRRYRR